jgi:hypothetical protein
VERGCRVTRPVLDISYKRHYGKADGFPDSHFVGDSHGFGDQRPLGLGRPDRGVARDMHDYLEVAGAEWAPAT